MASIEPYPEDRFGPLRGRSRVMRELFARLARVAATNNSVLVHGETGTGKELIARAIHEHSQCVTGPYMIVDCASLPENLVEAELFGHARGAFTGAQSARPGAFETAEGGTLFLDEIGELPLSVQPRLLRVLESRTVRRIGETHHRPINVRIVSATHRNLPEMVAAGAFREDLYFRLAVLVIEVPPLRKRTDDLPLLARHFLGDSLDEDFLARLASRPWFGNVRELRNFLERARTFGFEDAERELAAHGTHPTPTGAGVSRAATALAPDAFPPIEHEENFRTFRRHWQELGERRFLERMLVRYEGDVPALSRAAGVDRTYIYRLMRRHRIHGLPLVAADRSCSS